MAPEILQTINALSEILFFGSANNGAPPKFLPKKITTLYVRYTLFIKFQEIHEFH